MKGSISIENVSKIFKIPILQKGFRGSLKNLFHREYTAITAVNAISLDIAPGEIVGYIGPNGAGKTTTIKLLAGILHPTSGTIRVNGLIPFDSRRDHAMQIGAMFGNQTRLYWNLPVRESFELLRKIYSVDYPVFVKQRDELTAMLQIEDLLGRQTRTLSLGQRIRCELAAALIHSPPVIFLDEPTIGLDVSVKARVLEFLRELNTSQNKTFILTSHDVHDIETLARRVTVIDTGKILFDGNLDDFKHRFGSGRKTLEIQFERELTDADLAPLRNTAEIDITNFDGFNLRVILTRNMPPTQIITTAGRIGEIRDVVITGEPLTDMVRHIYENTHASHRPA